MHTRFTRHLVRRGLTAALVIFALLSLGQQTLGASNFIFRNPGVVRNGATATGCDSSPTRLFSVTIDEVFQAPPVILRVSAFPVLGPASQYSIVVTDPDGEIVPLMPGNGPGDKRFLATKVGVYSVNALDLVSGETASCLGGIRVCKSKTQQEWAKSDTFPGGGLFGHIFVGDVLLQRSVTVRNVNCLPSLLPAHGKIEALPDWLGNLEVDVTSCELPSQLPESRKVFKNSLLGEQIALSLNDLAEFLVLTEFTPVSYFGNIRLCKTVTVRRASNNSEHSIQIPASVISSLGPTPKIDGLMRLADRALAGDTNLGGTNLRDIHSALVEVNGGFGDGSLLVACSD